MLISIVMAVYNNEKYFPLAVKSIMEQDYPQWELIIIDDGSTDQTPMIADKIAESDSRIRVVHQKNQWIYASFNRGIEQAKGDYIYILNSDDRIRPGSLKLMAEKAIAYDPDVIWTKVVMHECDQEQDIIAYNVKGLDERVKEEVFYPNEQRVHEGWPWLLSTSLAQNQANLYRAKIMKKHKFRTEVYGADTLYNIQIAPDVKSALVMKEPVYDFFIYKKDTMNVSIVKFYPNEHDMFNEIYCGYMNLFSSWDLPEESYMGQMVQLRIKQVTGEINSLLYSNCPLSAEQKLEHVLRKIPDEVLMECARLGDRQEELESRILSGIRTLLIQEPVGKGSKMYFAYELLEALLCYEKDERDYRKIEEAMENPNNPAKIGQVFYKKLKQIRESR